jgi:hypothetical protein
MRMNQDCFYIMETMRNMSETWGSHRRHFSRLLCLLSSQLHQPEWEKDLDNQGIRTIRGCGVSLIKQAKYIFYNAGHQWEPRMDGIAKEEEDV